MVDTHSSITKAGYSMKLKSIITFCYSLIVLTGGVIGYIKAGSFISILTGIGFSFLLNISAILLFKSRKEGYYTTLALTTILTLFFCYRFFLSFNILPAGLMAVISIAMLAFLLKPEKKVQQQ